MDTKRLTKMMERIDRIKDVDPFNRRVLNDCYDVLLDSATEIARLRVENERKQSVIDYINTSLEQIAHENDTRI